MRTEIAVIGAGPAGAQAARWLAAGGLEVTLLEMRNRVGHPIQCGEAISQAALQENALTPGAWIRSEVEGVAAYAANGNPARLSAPGYCIDRGAFDRALVEMARDLGTRLLTSCHVSAVLPNESGVRLETSKGEFVADYVIAGDGPWSPTARSLGLVEGWRCNLGMQYKFPAKAVNVERNWLHLFLKERYGGGYAWIFPRGGEVSVGVDVFDRPRAHLAAFCRDWGLVITDRRETNGGRIPTAVRLRRLGAGRVLMVGDAAGATNPIFGGGIHAALSTGRLAAAAVLDAWENGRDGAARGYEKAARTSPFFHPVLLTLARVLSTSTDDDLAFAAKVYRRKGQFGRLLELLPALLRRPRMMRAAASLPALREALALTARYGW